MILFWIWKIFNQYYSGSPCFLENLFKIIYWITRKAKNVSRARNCPM